MIVGETERRQVHARRSAIRTVVSLAMTFGPVVAAALEPALLRPWFLVPLWLIEALGLIGLSNGAHEVVHGHMFFRKHLDHATGRLLHGLLLLNHDVHRRYHLTHHAHTGTERDSEGIFDFDSLNGLGDYFLKFARWAIPPSPLHLLNWREGFGAALGREKHLGRGLTRTSAAAGLVVPVLVVAAIVAWLVVDPVPALLMAVIPQFVIFPCYTYVMSLPEHFGLAPRAYSERTRNILTSRPIQYLLWNFNLHAVHHSNPKLHFSELPEHIDSESATASGYLSFHVDVIRELAHPIPLPAEQLGARR